VLWCSGANSRKIATIRNPLDKVSMVDDNRGRGTERE